MLTPAGLEAQTSVLGSILISPECLSAVRAEITPAMFPYDHQRAIFEAACQLQDEGLPVDPVTIKARVQVNGGEWENKYVVGLMDMTPTAANVMEYCKLLRQDAMARTLKDQINKASEDLMAGNDPLLVGQELSAAVEEIAAVENTVGVVDSTEAMVEFSDVLDRAEGVSPVHPTGYRKLDKILGGGLMDGCLYILAARPGQGKTTLGTAIAEHIASHGETVLFVSLEMTRQQLNARRIAAQVGTVTATSILTRDLGTDDMEKVTSAMSALSQRKVLFNRQTRVSVRDIQVLARQNKADIVIIDYLGLIDHGSDGKNLYERVTKTSNELKRMTVTLNIPVLCLAQLNREVEGRKGPPRMADLRDSGAIEQDADAILMLYRPEDSDDTRRLKFLDVIIAKNRYGPLDTVTLGWSLNNGRIVDGGNGRS